MADRPTVGDIWVDKNGRERVVERVVARPWGDVVVYWRRPGTHITGGCQLVGWHSKMHKVSDG